MNSSTVTPYIAPSLAELGRVHFIGLGGAGMSAIARIMLSQGITVSGSDSKDSSTLRELEALGARAFVPQQAENVSDVETVVVSSAIRETNPELAAARAAGLRVLHRSQALAAAMADDAVVAVAGTHGKTTTTSMITVMLRGSGVDASFAVGGTVVGLGVNAAHGTGKVFVAEADESDASFLNYQPQIAVVTNLEADHLDHYGTAEAVFAAFGDFVQLIKDDGVLVACADDPGALELLKTAEQLGVRCLSYGFAEGADVRIENAAGSGLSSKATLRFSRSGEQARNVELVLNVPGEHNLRNATAAMAVALECGLDLEQAAAALAGFNGAARRFEAKGEARGVRVFDDYAHHPTEVVAALTAARTVAGENKVHVLFQPHLFSRTQEFAAEFAEALDLADSIAVLDIYPAREDPIPGVTSELISAKMRHKDSYTPEPGSAVERLSRAASDGDIILTVGAGDVTEFGPVLVAALAASAQGSGDANG